MNDFEIDKALALAIGWKPEQMRFRLFGCVYALFVCTVDSEYSLREFSHKDWNVVGPIAERYDCFPEHVTVDYWCSSLGLHDSYADTPQKAVAMAVIQGAKK